MKQQEEDPDKKKFLRDQAKYVCRKCKKGFFTKTEVVQCYDSHEGFKMVKE